MEVVDASVNNSQSNNEHQSSISNFKIADSNVESDLSSPTNGLIVSNNAIQSFANISTNGGLIGNDESSRSDVVEQISSPNAKQNEEKSLKIQSPIPNQLKSNDQQSIQSPKSKISFPTEKHSNSNRASPNAINSPSFYRPSLRISQTLSPTITNFISSPIQSNSQKIRKHKKQQKNTWIATLQDLPDDILLTILEECDVMSVFKFACTCTRYRDLVFGSADETRELFSTPPPSDDESDDIEAGKTTNIVTKRNEQQQQTNMDETHQPIAGKSLVPTNWRQLSLWKVVLKSEMPTVKSPHLTLNNYKQYKERERKKAIQAKRRQERKRMKEEEQRQRIEDARLLRIKQEKDVKSSESFRACLIGFTLLATVTMGILQLLFLIVNWDLGIRLIPLFIWLGVMSLMCCCKCTAPSTFTRLLLGVMTLVMLVVFLVLMSEKVENDLEVSWAWCFFPIWIIAGTLIFFGIGMAWNASAPLSVPGFWKSSLPWTAWFFVCGLTALTFLILMVLKLDLDVEINWIIVFIPFWVGCFMSVPIGVGYELKYLYWISFWHELFISFLGGKVSSALDLFSNPKSTVVVLLYWDWILSIFITSVLLMFEIERDEISFDWWIVFIPIWVSTQLTIYHSFIFHLQVKSWNSRIFFAMAVVSSLSIICFTVLLLLYLSETIYTLQWVLFPLWLCLGMIPILGLLSFLEQFLVRS